MSERYNKEMGDRMKMKLKNILINMKEKSRIFQYLAFVIKKAHFSLEEKRFLTEPKINDNIRKMKGMFSGKRCFIVATGPSLTLDDLKLISGEISFGMNSIVKLYNKINWRPTFYGIQDSLVYEKLENIIKKEYSNSTNVFVGSNLAKQFEIPSNFVQFPFDHYYHEAEREIGKYFAKFSDDASSVVYDGYSITYSLIEIAVYMGFKEIYLLGCDCNYPSGKKNHFIESGFVDKNAASNPVRMRVGYEKAREYAGTHGIRIVNCTRGGMLEVYPRESLETVLNQKVDK